MRVGIDFDNTLVCYDAIFHKLAVDATYIPASLPRHKQAVRNHMREAGLEERWTELQGAVYGNAIQAASAYFGALVVLERLRAAGAALFIISHKTRHPFKGEPYDLHAAALRWLEAAGFLDEARTGLRRGDVFFEPTKEAKLGRIAACRCTHFVDDLPEWNDFDTLDH